MCRIYSQLRLLVNESWTLVGRRWTCASLLASVLLGASGCELDVADRQAGAESLELEVVNRSGKDLDLGTRTFVSHVQFSEDSVFGTTVSSEIPLTLRDGEQFVGRNAPLELVAAFVGVMAGDSSCIQIRFRDETAQVYHLDAVREPFEDPMLLAILKVRLRIDADLSLHVTVEYSHHTNRTADTAELPTSKVFGCVGARVLQLDLYN